MMERTVDTHEPLWLQQIRKEAFARFEAMSWPLVTEEEWRRSDVSRLGLDALVSAAPSEPPVLSARIPEALAVKGVRFLPFSQAASTHAEFLRPLLEARLAAIDNRFTALALARGEGALLWVPPGIESGEAIVVDTLAPEGAGHSLLVVLVGEDARVEIMHRVGGGSGASFANAVLDLVLAQAAQVGFRELQDLPLSTLFFRDLRSTVGSGSTLRHFDAELGASFVKSRLSCSLEGSGADVRLDGLYHCLSGQHMDLRTVQAHAASRCTSRATYKGAVEGGGRTVFQGLIDVAKGASGTDAFLANRNLLLGEAARSDSIPTLRIGNNDVRCSHGSTSGRLSSEELFYLESRGFRPEEARALLVMAWFESGLVDVPAAFATEILHRLEARIAREAKAA